MTTPDEEEQHIVQVRNGLVYNPWGTAKGMHNSLLESIAAILKKRRMNRIRVTIPPNILKAIEGHFDTAQ